MRPRLVPTDKLSILQIWYYKGSTKPRGTITTNSTRQYVCMSPSKLMYILCIEPPLQTAETPYAYSEVTIDHS